MNTKLNIGQKVIYVVEDPDNVLLKNKEFKIIEKHIFRDGSENYKIISEDGYVLDGVCNISQHITVIN